METSYYTLYTYIGLYARWRVVILYLYRREDESTSSANRKEPHRHHHHRRPLNKTQI